MEKLISLNNAMKTKSSLEWLFDHPEMVEGGQEYLDSLVEQDKENYLDTFYTDTSFLDYYDLTDYINESIPDSDGYSIQFDYSGHITYEYTNGYHLFHKVGDTIKARYLDSLKESIASYDIEGLNKEYTFIGCASDLGQEIEIQAENGNLAYYYLGERYFEVWIDSRFYYNRK